MRDRLETLRVEVITETESFARDARAMGDALAQALDRGAEAGARGMEQALARAARSGKAQFDELARAAARALGEAAGQGLGRLAAGALGGALAPSLATLGLPGRAMGGPVAPGRPYVVGERGPEVFVPASAGRVDTGPGERRVSIAVRVVAPPIGEAPSAMGRATGRQVAAAVRRMLDGTR